MATTSCCGGDVCGVSRCDVGAAVVGWEVVCSAVSSVLCAVDGSPDKRQFECGGEENVCRCDLFGLHVNDVETIFHSSKPGGSRSVGVWMDCGIQCVVVHKAGGTGVDERVDEAVAGEAETPVEPE